MEEPYSAWVDDLMDELVPSSSSTIHEKEDSISAVAIFADARYALTEGLREVEDTTGDQYGYQDFFAVDGMDERVRLYGVTPGKGTGKRGSAVDVYLDQLRDLSEMRLEEVFTVAEEELDALGYDEPDRALKDIAEDGVANATQYEIDPDSGGPWRYFAPRRNEELRQETYSLAGRDQDELKQDLLGIEPDGDA